MKLKKVIGTLAAMSITATAMPAIPQASAESAPNFDPQTVMWTNNKIENVLAEQGIYKNAAEVDPNANTSASTIQNPYGKPGEYLTNWAYSEFLWTHSYPVGNGRMAGMIAGGIDKEVIQINEDTCWDGSPYGTLKNEKGETVTTLKGTRDAETITAENPTSGSRPDCWKYFRGADADGNPAEIGAENAIVGDEEFRTNYPDYADKSIARQSLAIDNAKTQDAVQNRYSMEKMVEATFLGSPTRQRAYKSFVEVYLDFNQNSENATNYTKSLDMKTGVVTVEYDYSDSHFKRETFASYPDQAIVTHVESDTDLDFSAELHTYHTLKDGYYSFEKVSNNEVKVWAAITNGNKDNNEPATVNAIQLEAHMYLDGDGEFTVSDDNTTISINGGKEADIYVVGTTNYVDYLHLDNSRLASECQRYLDNIKKRSYDEIKARHLEDFSEQFNKTSIDLDNTAGVDYSGTPTEQRVRKNVNGKSAFLIGAASRISDANKNGVYSTYSDGDNELAALEFNYGKYLIISGSRDGREAQGDNIAIQESQPLNLTGKWNPAFSASWNGKYTININTEMNYWAAQPLNIADCERPFIDTFDELAKSGAITAANQYGIFNERGDDTYQPGDPWVMHHNYDLWRGTQPIDNATAGLWPTGGAWLLDHAWEYYLFTGDKEYLAEVYPYMVGSAKFFTNFLVIDPVTGYLITAASCSPEQGGVQPGPAMDTQLVRNLYDMVRRASEILGKTDENKDLLDKINDQMPSSYLADEKGKIAPNIIDNAGLINEWVRGDVTFDIGTSSSPTWTVTNPFKNNESVGVYAHTASNNSTHRHCSHLWEIFPGTHLSAYSDDANEQKIFKAYQKSVAARGTGTGQGWGVAWRINLNARALDGNAASTMIEQLLTTRTSPNMFDQHPNFQIDGNYGATSGIIEMLVQSHDGAIDILPALPDKWESGSINGINTRENATVDITWAENKPSEAKLHAKADGDIRVRTKYAGAVVVYDENGSKVESSLNDSANMITFNAESGKTYTVTNFGTGITEGSRIYKANETTEFYASDNGSVPKVDSDGVSIGYIYNRSGVKIGYAVNDFDFDNLSGITLNIKSVRAGDIYVSLHVDTPTGTEIANQIITTGDNELEIKNTAGISGTHKLYVLYTQNPHDGTTKYIGNANDITAHYSISSLPTQKPTTAPTEAPTQAPTSQPTQIPQYSTVLAAYNANGTLAQVKIAESEDDTIEAPEGGSVKIFKWDSIEGMKPILSAAAPTPPTTTPTSKPTEEPTEAPTPTPTPVATTAPDPNAVTAKYIVAEGDGFTAGTTLTVMEGSAQLTYGAAGGADFAAANANTSLSAYGYEAMTAGNGANPVITDGIPTSGTFYAITPAKDGKVSVGFILNANKAFYITEGATPVKGTFNGTEEELNGVKLTEKASTTAEFDVKAGNTYYIYCTGSKLGFFGFTFTFSNI